MALAALLGMVLAVSSPLPPEDDVIRDVLALVERTHLDAARIRPEAVLRAAAESLRRAQPAWSVTEAGGGLVLRDGERELSLAPSDGESLVERLGPPLESLLRFASEGRGERDVRDARTRILDGALRSLDRWSSASSGRKRQDQQARRTGERGVIGVRIGRREGRIRVLGVLARSGAEAAGIRAGDVLLAVAGSPVEGRNVSEILDELRGPAGSAVDVVLERLAPEPLAVERRVLREPSVKARLERGAAVVSISHVSTRSAEEVQAALAGLAGEGPPRAIVLDVRGNTGGSMLGAAGIADLFLSEGVLAEALDERDQPVPGLRSRVEATPGGDLTTPLFVLVDRRTASSAELLAAALSWHGRALIAGERTFGKIVVGKPHAFPGADLTVTITTAIMRTAGRRLPASGLEPDIAMDPRSPAVIAELLERQTTEEASPAPHGQPGLATGRSAPRDVRP